MFIVAKKPVAHYVDTSKGDKQQLEQSGLTPLYVNKKVRTHYYYTSLHNRLMIGIW